MILMYFIGSNELVKLMPNITSQLRCSDSSLIDDDRFPTEVGAFSVFGLAYLTRNENAYLP